MNQTARRRLFYVLLLCVAAGSVGGLLWKGHRDAVAEQTRQAEQRWQVEEDARQRRLAGERREREQRWNQASSLILRNADALVLSNQKDELWRAALLDAARELKRPARELRDDLEAGLKKMTAEAQARPACRSYLAAADAAFALYRLEEARQLYRQVALAPDAMTDLEADARAKERMMGIFMELGVIDAVVPTRQFSFTVAKDAPDRAAAVAAAVRLGRCQYAAGRQAEALEAFRYALAEEEKLGGPESPGVIVPLVYLFRALSEWHHFDEADPLGSRMIALSERHFGKDDCRTARNLLLYAEFFQAQERWKEAERESVRAMTICEKTIEPEHPVMEHAMVSSALAIQHTGRFAEAERLFRQLLDTEEAHLPPDHENTAITLGLLADVTAAQNRLAQAETLYRGALAILEKAKVANPEWTAQFSFNLGAMLYALHRIPEAESLLRQSIAVYERKFGVNHPKAARPLLMLGKLLKESGRESEGSDALARASQVLTMPRQAATARDQVNVLLSQANAKMSAGDPLAAERVLQEAIALAEKGLPATDPLQASLLNNLGFVLQNSGRLTEADRLLRRSLEITLKTFGPTNDSVADTMVNIASVATLRGESEDALVLMRRALEVYEISLGKEHPRVAITLNNLAYILHGLRRSEEAEKLQRRSVRIAETAFGPDHAETAVRLNFLGVILVDTRRFAEAEPVLRRVLVIAQKDRQNGSAQNLVNDVAGRYAKCLEALGKSANQIDARMQALRRGEAVGNL